MFGQRDDTLVTGMGWRRSREHWIDSVPLLGEFDYKGSVFLWYADQRLILVQGTRVEHLAKFYNFWLHVNTGMRHDTSCLPCMVSEAFSNETGFCLKMTLPFFSSAMEFLCAVAIDG